MLVGPLAVGLFASATVAYRFASARDWRRRLLAPVLCAAVLMVLFNPLAAPMRPSAKALCQQLKSCLQADTPVFSLNHYLQDLPVYLDRLVGVADYTPPAGHFEQDFGLRIENHADRYLDKAAFQALWKSPQRAYAVMTTIRYHRYSEQNPDWHAHVVFANRNFVLLSNQPDTWSPLGTGRSSPQSHPANPEPCLPFSRPSLSRGAINEAVACLNKRKW